MLILRASYGFPIGLWDGKLSLIFTYMQWDTQRASRQKYEGRRRERQTETETRGEERREIRKNGALEQTRMSKTHGEI